MVILLNGDNLRIIGVNSTNRALPNNRRLQLGVFLGTEPQIAVPEAEARVPHVVQSPPVVQGLLNDNYHLSVTHVDSYVKPAAVPHVDNCQNAQYVNSVEPVQEVGVNLSFVVTPVHTVFSNRQSQRMAKSWLCSEQNKACKRCFFCKSVFLCPKCSKCPSCCSTSSCGRSTSQVLAKVGCSGFQPESGVHSEGGLHSTLPDQTTSLQIPCDPRWVCQSPQEQLPEGGIGYPDDQKCGQNGQGSILSGILQPDLFGSETQQPLASDLGSEHLKHISQG